MIYIIVEESVFGNNLEATDPSTVLITEKETTDVNEQHQFAGLTETTHEKVTKLHPSSDQKVQDKLSDKHYATAQEGSLLTDITSNEAWDTTTAAQR